MSESKKNEIENKENPDFDEIIRYLKKNLRGYTVRKEEDETMHEYILLQKNEEEPISWIKIYYSLATEEKNISSLVMGFGFVQILKGFNETIDTCKESIKTKETIKKLKKFLCYKIRQENSLIEINKMIHAS